MPTTQWVVSLVRPCSSHLAFRAHQKSSARGVSGNGDPKGPTDRSGAIVGRQDLGSTRPRHASRTATTLQKVVEAAIMVV